MPDPIDVHVGSRLRLARKACSISQTAIGNALGVSFQQVQKYESGANRIGAGRLYRLARLFDVSVGFFFDDLPSELTQALPTLTSRSRAMAGGLEGLSLRGESRNREVLQLVSAFVQLSNPHLRTEIIAFLKAIRRPPAARPHPDGDRRSDG